MNMFFRSSPPAFSSSFLTGLLLLAITSPACADKLTLKHGGTVQGTLETPPEAGLDAGNLSFRTLSGTLITFSREEITEINQRPRNVEEYEIRERSTPNETGPQWQLALWCKKNELPKQWLQHLNQVLQLDPDHLLAQQTLSKAKNAVQKEEQRQRMLARGLVPYKGKYVTPKEKTLLEKVDLKNDREKEWWKKIRLWHRWLAHSSAARQQNGLAAFRGINSADALPALEKYLLKDQSVNHRLLYAEVLPNIPDPAALIKQIELSLYDENYRVRQMAEENIPTDRVDEAVTLYLQALKHPNNQVVRRAATALGQLGDLRVVPYLIETLGSTHTFQVRVPAGNAYNVSVNRNGSFANGSPFLPPEIELGLRTGQYPYGVIINDQTHSKSLNQTKLVTVTRELENPEVLSALKTITKENFGFNKLRWRSWWNDVRNGKITITPGNQTNS